MPLYPLPPRVYLLTQVIKVSQGENLHAEWVHEGEEAHAHKAHGVYSDADQTITLDADMAFERQRSTFLHENLHAMFAITQADNMMDAAQENLSEHVISVLTPVLLSWMRDNPHVVLYLQEMQ